MPGMKWIIFTGTWRLTNKEVEQDVRIAARQAFENGDGILTGGRYGRGLFRYGRIRKAES